MTNPQDIDKAFDAWALTFSHSKAELLRRGSGYFEIFRAGWAAALRAVQEPADADAFLADADKAFYEICTPEWYVSHSLGFGVKAAFLEGANWAAAATPPPPGAASPGVPARSQNGFTTADPTPAHCPMKCATMADCSGVCNFTEPAESCTWQEDDEAWRTSCGRAFSLEAGTPAENGMKWCCYCGRSITQGAPDE